LEAHRCANATTGSLLRLEGTELTVGDSDADAFSIASNKARVVLDLSSSLTCLKVYGDWQTSGPATNIAAYLADGRLVVTNDEKRLAEVYYDDPYTVVGQRHMKAPMLIVR
jgi:hypothetical protein